MLYFWNQQEKLIATAINVACPAQEVEGDSSINADYWHPVREKLKAKYGNDLFVLGFNVAFKKLPWSGMLTMSDSAL